MNSAVNTTATSSLTLNSALPSLIVTTSVLSTSQVIVAFLPPYVYSAGKSKDSFATLLALENVKAAAISNTSTAYNVYVKSFEATSPSPALIVAVKVTSTLPVSGRVAVTT